MTASEPDFSQHAGRVIFPHSPLDLTDTSKCPACFTPLRTSVCTACRLDLNHPAAPELFEASRDAVETLNRRAAIIGRMRYETDQLLAARAAVIEAPAADTPAAAPASHTPPAQPVAPAPPAPPAASTPPAARVPPTAPVPPAAPMPPAPLVGPGAAPPRRSSVQVALLVVGVSLLSIAAIFFLVYAFIQFGVVWRSIIIAAVTVAAIAGASLLRRRNLTATAEGIAAFAVVLVYLDAFAIRANDLFGLAGGDSQLYWGVVLVASSVGFAYWHRVSKLRMPNVAAYFALVPGVGALVSGSVTGDTPVTAYLALAAMGAAGLAHRVAASPANTAKTERTVVLVLALLALLQTPFTALTFPDGNAWAPAAAVLGTAVIAALVGRSLVRHGSDRLDRAFAYLFSGFAGLTAASAVAFSAPRIDFEYFWIVGPVIAAAAVALGLEAFARGNAGVLARSCGSVAAWCAAGVGAITLLVPVVTSAASVASALGSAFETWRWTPDHSTITPALSELLAWSIVGIVAVSVLAALAWSVTGLLRRRATALLWSAAFLATVAVPLLNTLALVFAAWLAIAVSALVALLALRGRDGVAPARAVLLTLVAVPAALGYLVGWASTSTWWIGTLVVIGILLGARMLAHGAPARAGLLGAAVTLALASTPAVVAHVTRTTTVGTLEGTINSAQAVGILAAVLLAAAALPIDSVVSRLDRRVAYWIALGASALALGIASPLLQGASAAVRAHVLLPEMTGVVTVTVLLVGLAAWLLLPANAPLKLERITASVALGPALYLLLTSIALQPGVPAFVGALAPMGAALLTAAASLAFALVRPAGVPRWAREVGVAAVAVPAVLVAVIAPHEHTWLVLLLAGVTTLLLAIDAQGLFASADPRRHIGWLALALATAGLWWRLRGEDVTAVEPYVLPLAAALLAVSALIARRTAHARAGAAPLVALAGLLTAVLPLAVNAATGPLARAVVIFAVSAALLLVGSLVVSRAAQPWLDTAALAGGIGVAVTAVGRAGFTPYPNVSIDAWVGALFIVLAVAAFGQARVRVGTDPRLRSTATLVIALMAMTGALALEVPQLTDGQLGGIRALALVLLFSAIHTIAYVVDVPPLTRTVAWWAVALAAVSVVTSLAIDAIRPIELATVPLALALLATGVVRLSRVPAARSWPTLGVGTALALVPSLIATMDDRPLWRLVAIGVAAVAVTVIGVVKRLQAPFVIGAVVALVHGVATFQPQLRAVYELVPWWLWLGAGGVLLIVLAARYERRIRNLKSVAMRFAALR